jgi:16S rRNA (cytidine1402-2'-O)-methyltransferase
MVSQFGTLYVVATPIGNLEDLSTRALKTLTQADKILAEDTRRTQQLLTHFGIKGSLVSLHDHNERQRIEQVIDWLQQGLQLALVSDAGTPLISDPGYVLVQALRQRGLSVVPIPGPSAIITALSAAGLPTDRFCFEGFLAAKSSARKKQLELLKREVRTCVFYESSHRIVDSLMDMKAVFGDERELVLARELTKRFETFITGTVASVLDRVAADSDQQRGEFVVMVRGVSNIAQTSELSSEQVLQELLPHLSTKAAAQVAANLTGGSKRDLYQMALAMKG